MPAPSGFDHVSTTKSNSTRSIATHPCKKRKDGAPSVGMVHAKIVKGGPPAQQEWRFIWLPDTDLVGELSPYRVPDWTALGHRHLRAFETFDWRVDHLLDKVQKLVAAARGLTNQLLYDSLLVVHSMPRDGDLFECSSVSQNSLSGVLYREEAASIFRWSDKEVGVVRHRGSQLVVGNIGERTGVVGRWNPLFRSTGGWPSLSVRSYSRGQRLANNLCSANNAGAPPFSAFFAERVGGVRLQGARAILGADSLDVQSHNTRSSGASLGFTVLRRETGVDRFAPPGPPTPPHFSFPNLGTCSAARPLSS